MKKQLGWDCLTVPLSPDRFPFLLQETATQEKGSEIGQSAGGGGGSAPSSKHTYSPISLLLLFPVSCPFFEIYLFPRFALQIDESRICGKAVAPKLMRPSSNE